jgi:hypothetical protein
MREALESVEYGGEVQIVRFKKCRGGASPSRNN